MKIGSDCSGECCVCACGGFCLAGHGDDDFSLASKEKIIENINRGRYLNYINYMKKTLKNVYGYDYDAEIPWAKWIEVTPETMPPEDEYILVTTEWHGRRETQYAQYHKYGDKDRFCTDCDPYGETDGGEIEATVTHWMSFPPPAPFDNQIE